MPTEESDKTTVSFDKRALKLDERGDAHEIVKAITEHSCVETLILSGNTMGIEAGEAIGESLKSHGELRRALWSDMFTGRSKAIIAPALRNLTKGVILSGAQLTELDLRDNAFGPTGVVGVTDLLGSRCCYTLKILRMDNEGLGHQGCKCVADALSKCLRDSQREGTKLQMEVFTAGRNRLENEGMKMLSEVFYEMKSLQELTLFQNGIGIHGPEGCEALARALSENEELRILNLSDNSLTAKGMKVLATHALPNLAKLEVLNVSDCILRSSGAKRLADALSDTTPNLRELYAAGNEIKRDVAIELLLSLKDKVDTMKVIDLNCNEFGEEGIEDIHEAAASMELQSCLLAMDDDEGCDEDEEGNGEEEEEYDDEDDDDEEEEEEEDSLEGDNKTPTPVSHEQFSFKTPEPVKSKSLFEGLPLGTSGGGLGSLFANPALVGCKPNTTSLFSSPSKSSGDRIFGSGATVPTNVGIFGDVKSPSKTTASTIGQHLFSNTQQKTSPESRTLFNDPKKTTTNTGLFGNFGTAPKAGGVSNGTNSSQNVLFKIPDAVASQAGKGQKPAASMFATAGSGSAQLIQPAKLMGAGPPTKEETNQLIGNFLRDSRKPQDESIIKRLSSVSVEDLKQYFSENPSLVESSVKKCAQCLDSDGTKSVGQSLLNATLMAHPTETTNHLMVELDLIKGETRKKDKLSTGQTGALLASIKTAFTQKLIPSREAKLLSFVLTEGPHRPNADEIRKRHRGDIDSLVACIEKDVGNLKL